MKELLSEKNIPFAYADIAGSMTALKSFLLIRDTSNVYENIRGTRSVGIPMLLIDGEPHIVNSNEDVENLITLAAE